MSQMSVVKINSKTIAAYHLLLVVRLYLYPFFRSPFDFVANKEKHRQ